MSKFLFGIVFGVLIVFIAGYVYVRVGGMPVATKSAPLPFEKRMAHMALRAAIHQARNIPSPIPPAEENLVAGAKIYQTNCAVCHGLPGQPPTPIARGMFPDPPQLFHARDMVTDDPIGSTFWKIKNGIRLTGMPGFLESLADTQIWQVSLLLQQADRLPPKAQEELRPGH